MSQIASLFFIFSSITVSSIARAQERVPHGLANENHPVTLPPSAVEFFHPKKQEPKTVDACASSKCSPFPVATQVETTQAYESRVPTSQKRGSRLTVGGIAGIVVGSAVVVVVAVVPYYVVITRRVNVNRANSVQPNA